MAAMLGETLRGFPMLQMGTRRSGEATGLPGRHLDGKGWSEDPGQSASRALAPNLSNPFPHPLRVPPVLQPRHQAPGPSQAQMGQGRWAGRADLRTAMRHTPTPGGRHRRGMRCSPSPRPQSASSPAPHQQERNPSLLLPPPPPTPAPGGRSKARGTTWETRRWVPGRLTFSRAGAGRRLSSSGRASLALQVSEQLRNTPSTGAAWRRVPRACGSEYSHTPQHALHGSPE